MDQHNPYLDPNNGDDTGSTERARRNPPKDITDREFAFLFKTLCDSGCVKRPVAAGTYVDGKFVSATNQCRANYRFPKQKQLEFKPEQICGRTEFADEDSPEALASCAPLHAEQELAKAIKAMGKQCDGIVWVANHYYACRECAQALKEIGAREIRVRHIPGSETVAWA